MTFRIFKYEIEMGKYFRKYNIHYLRKTRLRMRYSKVFTMERKYTPTTPFLTPNSAHFIFRHLSVINMGRQRQHKAESG